MSDILEITHSSSIPEIFHSEKEKQLFTQCSVCGKKLKGTNELYIIEKAFEKKPESNKHDLVFELACCMDCREEINQTLSEESRQKIDAYFRENTDLQKKDQELKKHDLMEHDIWLQNCVVKNKSIDEVDAYQIYALCFDDEMIYHQFPFMLCGETIDEIVGLLSNKSLDILNDFMTDLIDLPPEFNEMFGKRKILIL
jgi:hypothetical protein